MPIPSLLAVDGNFRIEDQAKCSYLHRQEDKKTEWRFGVPSCSLVLQKLFLSISFKCVCNPPYTATYSSKQRCNSTHTATSIQTAFLYILLPTSHNHETPNTTIQQENTRPISSNIQIQLITKISSHHNLFISHTRHT